MAISEIATRPETGGATKNREQEEDDEKPRTLFVGNVPREIHKREIEEIFGEVGPLKRCYIQYPRDGNEKRKQREDTTVAYVTFALPQDATKALETLQNSRVGSNKINIKFAKTRSEQVRPSFGNDSRGGRFRKNPNLEPLGGEEAVPKPKEPRPKAVKKKSRLIVRNLSFKVTKEKMNEYFGKLGDVKDVNILKKPNGKLVGCAFIQYQNVFQAAKAIKELNMKPFLGRPIAIDWALPKEKYQTDDEKQKKKDEASTENDTIEIKDEPESEAENSAQLKSSDNPYEHLKEEPMDIQEIKTEDEKPLKSEIKKRKLKTESDTDEEEDDDSAEEKYSQPPKKPKQLSNDVEEGKTLFLRNLSFDTKEDDLKQFFEKFGDLHYALICKDSLTEHPKGTGFIKYKNKFAADRVLRQFEDDSSEFTLSGRQFNISVAISREQIGNRSNIKQGEKKDMKPKADSRNLYLTREGFIRPGSAAAADVSQQDMHKRASLNKVKKQMLKNLNILISPTRLCVHNLPTTYSDTKLRTLFKKYGGPSGKVIEARIMRDMNDLNLDGKGKSKGYGFVTFTDHEHALTALRSVNNNPSIFKANSRPIVEFSMENKLALNAKEKRTQKSKEKNPNNPHSTNQKQQEDLSNDNEDDESNDESSKAKKKSKKKDEGKRKSIETGGDTEETKEDIPNFAGLKSKKGIQTIPNFKPKGKITRNSLKPKRIKKNKKQQERKQREPKVPSKRPLDKADKTEKIISKYKKNLDSSEGRKKKKWFE